MRAADGWRALRRGIALGPDRGAGVRRGQRVRLLIGEADRGHGRGRIGVADQLAPAANDHILARLIPGARLVLYPDAGHAFLFQEGTPFASRVESFLTGSPSA